MRLKANGNPGKIQNLLSKQNSEPSYKMLIVSQLTAHKRAQPRKIVQINKESINFDTPD